MMPKTSTTQFLRLAHIVTRHKTQNNNDVRYITIVINLFHGLPLIWQPNYQLSSLFKGMVKASGWNAQRRIIVCCFCIDLDKTY